MSVLNTKNHINHTCGLITILGMLEVGQRIRVRFSNPDCVYYHTIKSRSSLLDFIEKLHRKGAHRHSTNPIEIRCIRVVNWMEPTTLELIVNDGFGPNTDDCA